MKKTIASILVLAILAPSLSFAQQLPSNMEEGKEILEEGIEVSKSELPGKIKDMWNNEVWPVWVKMWDWFDGHIFYMVRDWFKKDVEPEIEKRKPGIKDEFEKEKEEVKEELPQVGKSLWDKFKEIIK